MWRREIGKVKELARRPPDGRVGSRFVLLRTAGAGGCLKKSKTAKGCSDRSDFFVMHRTTGGGPDGARKFPGLHCDISVRAHMTKSIPRSYQRAAAVVLRSAGRVCCSGNGPIFGQGDCRHADFVALLCTRSAARRRKLPGAAAARRRNNDSSRRRTAHRAFRDARGRSAGAARISAGAG